MLSSEYEALPQSTKQEYEAKFRSQVTAHVHKHQAFLEQMEEFGYGYMFRVRLHVYFMKLLEILGQVM